MWYGQRITVATKGDPRYKEDFRGKVPGSGEDHWSGMEDWLCWPAYIALQSWNSGKYGGGIEGFELLLTLVVQSSFCRKIQWKRDQDINKEGWRYDRSSYRDLASRSLPIFDSDPFGDSLLYRLSSFLWWISPRQRLCKELESRIHRLEFPFYCKTIGIFPRPLLL